MCFVDDNLLHCSIAVAVQLRLPGQQESQCYGLVFRGCAAPEKADMVGEEGFKDQLRRELWRGDSGSSCQVIYQFVNGPPFFPGRALLEELWLLFWWGRCEGRNPLFILVRNCIRTS
jgi:hypothetical protein